METRANYVVIGLFTLMVIATAIGFVYWLARVGTDGEPAELTVVFNTPVFGLAEGSVVTFNGLKIGEIISLKQDKKDPHRITALASVKANAPIKSDTRAKLGSQGLTGISFLDLVGGSTDAPNLLVPGGGATLIAQGASVQDLLEGAKDIMSQVDMVVQRITNIVNVNEDKITQTIDNVESFTGALAKNSDKIDTLIVDVSAASRQIAQLSQKLETTVEQTNQLIAAIEPESVRMTVANVEKFSSNLANSGERMDAIMLEAENAAKTVSQLSVGLGNTLVKVDQVVEAIDPIVLKKALEDTATFTKSLATLDSEIQTIVSTAHSATDNVYKFTETLAGKSEDIDGIFADARVIATQLKNASEKIDGIMSKVDTMFGGSDAGGLFAEVGKAAQAVRKVAETFEAKADEITTGLARFSGRGLREVETFISDGQRALKAIERAADQLERNPQRLLFGNDRKLPEYRPNRH